MGMLSIVGSVIPTLAVVPCLDLGRYFLLKRAYDAGMSIKVRRYLHPTGFDRDGDTHYASIKPVTSIEEFVTLIRRLNNRGRLLFRGQTFAKDLLPRVGRDGQRCSLTKEKEALKNYWRSSPGLLPSYANQLSDLDLLSIAQHHGMATRLLDWTESALTGLWFAVQERNTKARTEEKYPKDRVVWVFAPDDNDYLDPDEDGFNVWKIKLTKVFKPRNVADRIRSQSGWFTVHARTSGHDEPRRVFVPFNKNPRHLTKLFCITVDTKSRDTIFNDLDRCGVNSFSVYPDLAGLSEYLNLKMRC